MRIVRSNPEDIDAIFALYDAGTSYQKTVAEKHWAGFERSLVEEEIRDGRQYKILEGDQIACVFVISFRDPLLWHEKDSDPSIYLHRIATNPDFRGRGYVKHIVDWSREYAEEHGQQYIRMDTGSGNDKLNDYYVSCGFTYLGIIPVADTEELPLHYRGGNSSLFELKLRVTRKPSSVKISTMEEA
jgi:ribosomal protein S18 acetylase RimI-like enzyme